MTTAAGLFRLVPPCPRSIVRRFPAEFPNRGMLESVVAGRNPGVVFVDDPLNPRAVVVVSRYCWAYASDAATAAQCAAVVDVMRREQQVTFLVPPGSPQEGFFPEADARVDRREFSTHAPSWSRSPALPQGVAIGPMTLDRFDQYLWKQEVVADCGSFEVFERIGLGRCAVHEGRPVCEAYGSIVGDETIEIGIITHPDWRSRGLAFATCAALIEAINARGYRPWWSCDADNLGSQATARKLGFSGEREYRFHVFERR